MSDVRFSSASARRLLPLLPALVLALTLGATWYQWQHERQASRQALRAQFDFALRENVNRIEQRVQGYEQMLRGVQSLFATTALSHRAALRDYVQGLQLDANFSGVQSIGVVEWVPAAHRAAHLAALRRAGFPQYALNPDGEREAFAPIVQREPYVGLNRAPIGTDVWLDPVRRPALEKARDSGLSAITGKVRLKLDTRPDAAPGFILYLPIYARGHVHDSVLQRRAHLIGWVYAAFHMNEFMSSLYGTQPDGLELAMYDGTDPTEASLLHRSTASQDAAHLRQPAAISANEYMVVAGHSWTLSMRTLSAFEERYGRDPGMVVGITGSVLSLLLALITWQMVNGRIQALRLAAEMTEELRHMAQHDALTDLPNRALFSDRLNQELVRAKRQRGRFAMLFLDLDRFKPINDSLGHGVGDMLLSQVARRLQDSVRAADTVGRIGGDEFVVLMAQLSESDSTLALANKLRDAMRQAFRVEGHELSISCSIGVAVYPDDGSEGVGLTKAADDAMYRAKQAGGDCVELCSGNR